MRSRTGCLTCRQRKLKCDEEKPACGQCLKATRQCQPSSGITFRHHHNASMNAPSDTSDDIRPLNGFYAYKNTFDHDVHWMAIPSDLKFLNITDPLSFYAGSASDEPRGRSKDGGSMDGSTLEQEHHRRGDHVGEDKAQPNTHGLEALSAAALSTSPTLSHGEQSEENRSRLTDMSYLQGENAEGSVRNFDLDPPPPSDPSIDPSLTQQHSQAVPEAHKVSATEHDFSDADVERKINALLGHIDQTDTSLSGHPQTKDDGG